MPVPMANRHGAKVPLSSSVAKKAARNAMTKAFGTGNNEIDAGTGRITQSQLNRVVQSVNDATNRLSQPEPGFNVNNPNTKSSKRKSRDTVGPWKLGKTLGKGSSGRVRLAKNMQTGQLAAIKIVPKKKCRNGNRSTPQTTRKTREPNFSTGVNTATAPNGNTNAGHSNAHTNPNPYGIEREIVIMKLISHPNVLGLYEVWENKSELYLVLEYVDGGELFDYLVSRGKLGEREAVHYFKQIIQGVSYCHSFNICHRDLKPENLLLDKKNKSIKIADFGMAALEVSNKPLQTSCGSPHYASPEIVMGRPYHGGPSDVWSCGIILFALLTGHLPFNDDNIKKLLLKVQSGKFIMPQNLSPEAKDLISKILVVNPFKRIATNDILNHPFLTKYDKLIKPLKFRSAPSANAGSLTSGSEHQALNATKIANLTSREDIDDSIVSNLQILLHGTSRELIIARLLQRRMSDEKLFYSLLLNYKEKHSPTQPEVQIKQETDLQIPPPVGLSSSNMMENSLPTEEENTETQLSKTQQEEYFSRTDETAEASTPKLQQKSQFSSPSVKQQAILDSPSIRDISLSRLPSVSLNPNVAVFKVPSQRTFRNSGPLPSMPSKNSLKRSLSKSSLHPSASVKSFIHASPSALSLHRSTSAKSIHRSPKKTLQNSASKRSLYSQTSISKRSLNLNEYVANENAVINEIEQQMKPDLPSSETNGDFEKLCEQILFGNALDKILEEENEDDVDDVDEGENRPEAGNNNPSQQPLAKKDISYPPSYPNTDTHVSRNMPPTFDFSALKSEDTTPYFASRTAPSVEKDSRFPLKDITNNHKDTIESDVGKLKGDVSQKSSSWALDLKGLDINDSFNLLLHDPQQSSKQRPEPNTDLFPVSKEHVKSVQPVYSLDPRHKEIHPHEPEAIDGSFDSVKKNEKYSKETDDWGYAKGSFFNTDVNTTLDGKVDDKHQVINEDFRRKFLNGNLDNGPGDLDSRRNSGNSNSSILRRALHESQTESDSHTNDNSCVTALSDTSDMNVLAHSSLIHKPNCNTKRSSLLSHTGTFRNLNEYLQNDDNRNVVLRRSHEGESFNHARKSPEIALEPRNALTAGLGSGDNTTSFMTNISDMSYVMEMPSNTSEAQIVEVSNNNSADQFASNDDKEIDQSSPQGQHTTATLEDTNVNIFEDAPVDSESVESTSSEDSRQNIRRKAVSIDTLRTTNLLTPARNVRVSLYVNNVNADSPLERETTEEIISKFKLSPEKSSKQLEQKRYSTSATNRNSDIHSAMTMFQDVEEEKEFEDISQKPSISSIGKGQQKKNRVTMLFDNDENLPQLEQHLVSRSSDEQKDENKVNHDATLNKPNDEEPRKKEVSVTKESQRPNGEHRKQAIPHPPIRPRLPARSEKERTVRETLPSVRPSPPKNASKLNESAPVTGPSGTQQTHKTNWLRRLFGSLKYDNGRLQHEHFTKISFDDAHLIALHEFEKNSVAYHLRSLDHKLNNEKVEYDCKFPNGFAFRIKITTRVVGYKNSTILLVKKKGKGMTSEAKRAFQKFNQDVANVIKEAEAKGV